MRHITKYNLAYLIVVLVLFGLSLVSGAYYKKPAIPILGLVVIFLIPGAIQGFFWNEFFVGRRLIRLGQFQEAMEHFQKFLDQIKVHAWMKKLIHTRWAAYTGDIEAMAWSNLGVIHINRGDVDGAERSFQRASEIDPAYPIPYFNLSLISLIKEKDAEAHQLWQKAHDLGYRKGGFEDMVKLSKEVKKKIREMNSE